MIHENGEKVSSRPPMVNKIIVVTNSYVALQCKTGWRHQHQGTIVEVQHCGLGMEQEVQLEADRVHAEDMDMELAEAVDLQDNDMYIGQKVVQLEHHHLVRKVKVYTVCSEYSVQDLLLLLMVVL